MRRVLISLVAAALGCTTLNAEHVLTGKPRPTHSGDVMLRMEGSPDAGKFEEVAIVNATGSAAQATLPAVLGALKEEARKLGCNAVIRVRYDRGTSNASATGVAVWME
jgi:hypothetical protein